jgi:peptidoglycan/LPS O-acetylase OafA/YrhL
MEKLRCLQTLRAIAALLVVFYHIHENFREVMGVIPFGGLFGSGFRGVDLFFVLSGFIIAYVHAPDLGRPLRLSNYLFNRAARIYPAVWIMSAFAVGLYAFGFGGADKAGKLAAGSIAASVLLLPQAGDALVNVSWSLKYEIFFYLVFAVVILDLWIGLALLAAWQLAVLAASIWFPPEAMGLGGFYLRSLCLDFSVGLGCAWLIGNRGFVAAMQPPALQWALLVSGIAAFLGGMAAARTPSAGVACAVGSGAIIVGMILLERSERVWMPAALVLLGNASYSIYLVHFSIIKLLAVLVAHFDAIPRNAVVFLACGALGVVAGVAFDRWLDQPIQRFLQRRLKPALLGKSLSGGRARATSHGGCPKSVDRGAQAAISGRNVN